MQTMPQRAHIVCVSTAREITNLLPGLALGATRALSVCTEYAHEQRWAEHLAMASGWEVEPITLTHTQEYAPGALAARVVEEVLGWRAPQAPVALLWGGGQKPHAVGMWRVFEALHAREPEAGHLALYLDPRRGVLVWTSPVDVHTLPHTNLATLEQAVLVAGCEPLGPEHGKAPCALYRRDQEVRWPPEGHEDLGELYERFEQDAAFRKACLTSASSGTLAVELLAEGVEPRALWEFMMSAYKMTTLDQVHEVVRQAPMPACRALLHDEATLKAMNTSFAPWFRKRMHERLVSALKTVLGAERPRVTLEGSYARFSSLFEALLAERVRRWACGAGAPLVEEIALNYHFRQHGHQEQEAELDVVIWTRSGKLIVLDAKTHKQDGATRRAQERSVSRLGGVLASRFAVVPAFGEDRAQSWYPTSLNMLLARDEELPRRTIVPFDETGALEDHLGRVCR